MKLFTIFILLLITVPVSAQSIKNIEFEKSKGHWPFPISCFSQYISTEDYSSLCCDDLPMKNIVFFAGKNDSVNAVFKGSVQTVFSIGDCFAVMVRFGDFYITYAYLDSPNVKKGDHITQGQYLGLLTQSCNELELLLSNKNDQLFEPCEWFNWESLAKPKK